MTGNRDLISDCFRDLFLNWVWGIFHWISIKVGFFHFILTSRDRPDHLPEEISSAMDFSEAGWSTLNNFLLSLCYICLFIEAVHKTSEKYGSEIFLQFHFVHDKKLQVLRCNVTADSRCLKMFNVRIHHSFQLVSAIPDSHAFAEPSNELFISMSRTEWP